MFIIMFIDPCTAHSFILPPVVSHLRPKKVIEEHDRVVKKMNRNNTRSKQIFETCLLFLG